MAKPLSILFVSSEVFPFAKVGGIADVAYSLPLAVRDVGHDIRVMLPKYGNVSERKNKIHEINRLKHIPIKVGNTTEYATVKSSSINNPRTKVQAYITTNTGYFDNNKFMYDDPKTGREYILNDERFIFFNRSVIETCILLGWYPDIIHCNDWQTALIPAYARAMFPNKFRKTKLVFTIHNIGRQGIYPDSTFAKTSLPAEIHNNLTNKKTFNFIKPALIYSDYITTVSPAYSSILLKDKEYTGGLNKLLSDKKYKFTGILNGIDTWGWNPKTDACIAKKFTNNFKEYKSANRLALQKIFGLEPKDKVPVIGMISHIEQNKGIKLLIDSFDKLIKENLQIVFLGEGDPDLKNELNKLAKKHPAKFAVKFEYNDVLAHQIEAGSDMFLMPSIIEPCGLNAMYSLVYGSVPVVRSTGGLSDIVSAYKPASKEGNGFVFLKDTPEDLLAGVKTALKIFQNKEAWNSLALKGMNGDYSWEKSVKKYDEIYRNIMKD